AARTRPCHMALCVVVNRPAIRQKEIPVLATATSHQALPHWNLDQYFPGVTSPEFANGFAELKRKVSEFSNIVDEITGGASDPVAAHDRAMAALIDALEDASLIMTYLSTTLAVNSRDDDAQRAISEAQIALIPLRQANTRLTAWIGEQDVEHLIASSELARQHEFLLRKTKIEAEHLMSQEEEALASELTLSGGSAFGKLHDDLTSQIMVRFEKRPGEEVELPMSEVRNLANDPDREVRRRAFEAEVAAWKQWETAIAAALNGVKGEHVTLARKRKWESALDQALFQNHIDRTTLDAMMTAAREAFPDIRRYWKAKAKALGVDKLMWFDIVAPVGENTRVWSWDEGMAFLLEQFGTY